MTTVFDAACNKWRTHEHSYAPPTGDLSAGPRGTGQEAYEGCAAAVCLRGILPTSMEGPRAGSGYVGTRGGTIEPRAVHSSPSSERCSHTQWCVAGTLPDHQEELSCLTAPCLAAPACSVRPLTAARSSAACVQTACDVLLTLTTDNHGCAITMCVKTCSHPAQGAPGRYYPPALA